MARRLTPARLPGKWCKERTRELAVIAGRNPPLVLQVDYEQAKRELTGTWDEEQPEAMLDVAKERDSPDANAVDGKSGKNLSTSEMTSPSRSDSSS